MKGNIQKLVVNSKTFKIANQFNIYVDNINSYKENYIKELKQKNIKYEIFENSINNSFIIESKIDNVFMNVLRFDINL